MKLTGINIANGVAGIKIMDNEDGTYSVFLIHYGDQSWHDKVLAEKIKVKLDDEQLEALGADWNPEICKWIPRHPDSIRADVLFKILES